MKTLHPHAYVLNVLSDDHPGIVAAVCDAVAERSGNIDSCSQTVVGGYFTLIMIASFPDEQQGEALADAVRSKGTNLQVVCRPQAETDAKAPLGERFVLTVVGPDQPGIVRTLSQYCAGKDINITDLFGHREGDNFVVLCETEIPAKHKLRLLQAELEELGREIGVTIRLQHENIFIATNQLRLR